MRILSVLALLIPFALTAWTSSSPEGKGELTHFGNKWGWAGTSEAFVPQLVMYATPPHFYGNPGKVDRDIETFLGDFGFSGFHVFLSCRWFDIGEDDCRDVEGKDPPVDPRTFEALEMLIRKTHRAGGMVHLWAWGDEERGQTPSARPDWGGLGGPVARKVEKEIARRWGDLPGWSMGYGFDLDEWVSAGEIRAWRDRLSRFLPGFHFLGGRPGGPNQGTDHQAFARWNRHLDYASYEHHKPSYAVYAAALEANPAKPVMSEDRFRVLDHPDPKHYSPQEVRRGLWHSMLAGGVANIWGYLLEGGSHELGSRPFPNRGQIRAYFEFVRGRFRKGMARCSPQDTDPRRRALCLGDPTGPWYIFYKEGSDRVELDLRRLRAPEPAVAVDTRRPYAEIRLGELSSETKSWKAPHRSDWVVAVGRFGREPRLTTAAGARPAAPAAPAGLEVRSTGSGTIELSWTDESHDEEGFALERASGRRLPGAFERIATLEPGRTRFVDSEAPRDETYWYRVRAFNARGSSGYTETRRVFIGAGGILVSHLRPASYRMAPLAEGDRYYLDRDYTLARVPSLLEGASWILTANDDKFSRAARFLSFEVSGEVAVYVGFDRRAKRPPRWLEEFERVSETIEVEGDAMGHFELYRRDFRRGEVVLGGTSAPPSDWGERGRSHYVVAIVPN